MLKKPIQNGFSRTGEKEKNLKEEKYQRCSSPRPGFALGGVGPQGFSPGGHGVQRPGQPVHGAIAPGAEPQAA